MPAASSTGWKNTIAEFVTPASDFVGSKKPLILKGFVLFDACDPTRPKLDSTHRKEAMADAETSAENLRTDSHRHPPHRSIRLAHHRLRTGDTVALRPKDRAATRQERWHRNHRRHRIRPARLPQAAWRGFFDWRRFPSLTAESGCKSLLARTPGTAIGYDHHSPMVIEMVPKSAPFGQEKTTLFS
jgi:hypothetical protein